MHTELPEPSSVAREHSARLVALLCERIAAAGGWLSFRDYMQAALYEPGLGYYSAGAAKFGAAGDFVTAPEISPLFSRCLAGQLAEVLTQLGGGDVLELGPGSGRMAADMLNEFAALGVLPDRYMMLEPSADLRERQQQMLAALPDELSNRVHWLDALPDEPVRGAIVGNEVVDAIPVRRFVLENGAVGELGVCTDGESLGWAVQRADDSLREAVAELEVPETGDYVSEVCMDTAPWLASLADCLAAGVILLLDYGYSRGEYYLAERREGTLRCYYRHRAHDDALLWPGLQDITAWVDFTALAEAGARAGLDVAGYTTQAQFLLAAGIDRRVEAAFGNDSQAQVTAAHGLRQLMLPGEMGDSIKAMVFTRDTAAPSGFSARDLRTSL